jgi:predicted CxxxxCH...CXXCH cytochrome family protein
MHTAWARGQSLIKGSFIALLAAALASGCGGSGQTTSSGAKKGVAGGLVTLTVRGEKAVWDPIANTTVILPDGGLVTSVPLGIDCGDVAGVLHTTCSAAFPYGTFEALTATTVAPNTVYGWAGACVGTGACNVEMTSDRLVVIRFAQNIVGLGSHPNFSDPAVHGAQFWNFIEKVPGAYPCTSCHGTDYGGMGTALSCNDCHARNGFPNWMTTCNFCHGAPPPPPGQPQYNHPVVSSDITTCTLCHPDTVDATGKIVPGGLHMNGHIDGGHPAGFSNPQIHGREFFGSFNAGVASCTHCHGANFDALIAPNSNSCNTCHQKAGWLGGNPSIPGSGWQTNCSFCHGVKSAQTQAGPYDVTASPTQAAPPDSITMRLGTAAEPPERVGAHTKHLTSPWAKVACTACHTVPSTLTHISGKDVRATVIVTPPAHPSDPSAYDPAAQTCATYCHDPLGAGTLSPAWTAGSIACNGCHPVPPATGGHIGLATVPQPPSSSDLVQCSGCHPKTINPDGTFNTDPVTGLGHINGNVDSPANHAAQYYLPVNHGNAYLDHLASVSGALDCASCHTGYANCNGCHPNPAALASADRPELASYTTPWVSWSSNCTFCHGTKTATYDVDQVTSTSLDGSVHALAAPPDAISQRFDGNPVPAREGYHRTHLNNGAFAPSPDYNCAACHTVPATVGQTGHVTADRRAVVALSASAFPGLSVADAAKLPNPLGTYDPVTGSCNVYCHGSTMQGTAKVAVSWDQNQFTLVSTCTDCHGSPPLSGSTVVGHTYTGTAPLDTRYCGTAGCVDHDYHRRAQTANGYDSCANCHYGSAQGTFYSGIHANGKANVVPSASNVGAKPVTFTYVESTKTCSNVSCHTKSGTGAQTW